MEDCCEAAQSRRLLKRFPVEMNRVASCRPCIRLILRRAQVRAHPRMQSSRSARLERWTATDLGFTRDRQSMCASRASPTCVFETPRTRLQNLSRHKIAAPHHEAERDRECIEFIEIRFRNQPLKGAPVSYAVGSKQYLAVQSSGRHV